MNKQVIVQLYMAAQSRMRLLLEWELPFLMVWLWKNMPWLLQDPLWDRIQRSLLGRYAFHLPYSLTLNCIFHFSREYYAYQSWKEFPLLNCQFFYICALSQQKQKKKQKPKKKKKWDCPLTLFSSSNLFLIFFLSWFNSCM